MGLPRLLMLTLLIFVPALWTQAADEPSRPTNISAELWDELLELDERLAAVESLRGRFERHRHTPLLRQPLVSEGTVQVKGNRARWETEGPSPSTTVVDGDEVKIYQPEDRRLEVYALDDRAEQLGGPVPRLSAMVEAFELESVDADTLFGDLGDDEANNALALRLTPRDDALAEELDTMALLLERETGRVLRLRTQSSESQWTEYRFLEIETNVELADDTFDLTLPSDVEVVRPMEGNE